MLRFATVVLSNPAHPDIPAVTVRAIVTDEPFALSIGQRLVDQLKLEQTALREVREIGESSVRLFPYVGPVRVTVGAREAFAGAINCAAGVVIGKALAEELAIDSDFATTRDPLLAAARLHKTQSADMILMKENVIDAKTCREICDFAARQPREQLAVLDTQHKSNKQLKDIIDTKSRDTMSVDIGPIEPMLKDLFYRIFTQHVEPFFGVEIERWDVPQLLSYHPGGHYGVHADGDRWVKKPDGKGVWERYLDRDVSILLYLNDNFTGGLLNFPRQKIKIRPKPGLLVAFPSSSKYRHGAEPTESGERLVLVTWSAAAGSPRVREKDPYEIEMEPLRKAKA